MAKKHLFITIFLISFYACDVFNIDEDAPVYPSQLSKLELGELIALNEKFQSQNNNICSTLNEYGLTGYSTVLFDGEAGPCLDREPVQIELAEPDTLLSIASEALISNSEFTGVSAVEDLVLLEMEPLRGCISCDDQSSEGKIIEWKFVFENQKINGLEVYDSSITVFVDANGVNRIWGNWFEQPIIPLRASFLPEEIADNLEGQTLKWNENGEEYQQTITADQLKLPEEKIIIPFENEENNKLELRVGWKIEVPSENTPFGGWVIIGDIINGRILEVDKLMKSNDF
ncbi:hypothetical protein [Rhodohalobacter sp.]|uniref:hypothetical protein n=1 Tax=Rhodohalobacter sp. TaxID=1974210 RepID=UPI003561820C